MWPITSIYILMQARDKGEAHWALDPDVWAAQPPPIFDRPNYDSKSDG